MSRRVGATAVLSVVVLVLLAVPNVAYAVTWPLPLDRYALAWGEPSCRFGSAVAIWGDTMAVSAPAAAVETITAAGKVAVFERRGVRWIPAQTLAAPTPRLAGRFGESLAIRGDVMAVGAPLEDSGSGAVYIFVRSGGIWTFSARIPPPWLEARRFGWSVSLYGDKLAIGCPMANVSRGAVFIYRRNAAGTWESLQQIDDPAMAYDDYFGTSVALYGDWLLASNPGQTVSDVRAGAVHAYRWNESADRYDHAQQMPAPDTVLSADFGRSLAVDRDVLVVGAPGMPGPGPVSEHGMAYLFQRSGTTWSLVSRLMSSYSLGVGAQAGAAVSVSGDTIAVGAPGAVSGKGLVQMYSMSGLPTTALQQACNVNPPTGTTSDARFGTGLGLSGGNLGCGAPYDDAAASDGGSVAAYIFQYPLTPDRTALRVSGTDRYLTNVEASKRGFPFGAPAVVVCTGENWPDALGGAGLAGAVHGPVLLTRSSALPAATVAEIKRLGAVKAYVIGGTGAVSASVENALRSLLGSSNVQRLQGPNRYATAQAVAAETIRQRGSTYAGGAFVATGDKYPDAVAVSPLAAFLGTPLLLANPASTSVDLPSQVTYAVVAGGESAVSAAHYADLVAKLGASNVVRKYGLNRYETAAALAQLGVDGGMNKSGVGLATGENFPDALSAGPMLGAYGCPLLLTRSTVLSEAADLKLRAWRPNVSFLHVVGGTGAVSEDVKNAAADAAWGP
ncbi:MAG: cell wall-binding repeat-containing protein [Anaerosomatales bacterium]|nr:cell wall-binding repeat-containing protein [Anaerosomatales bacterium]